MYKERLIHLDLLPLTYDREIKDLVFLYKVLYGYIDIDITFIKSVSHGHSWAMTLPCGIYKGFLPNSFQTCFGLNDGFSFKETLCQFQILR